MPQVVAIHSGTTRETTLGRLKRTAIDKQTRNGPVYVSELGLVGDDQADGAAHGGRHRAVSAYEAEAVIELATSLGLVGRPDVTAALDARLLGVNLTISTGAGFVLPDDSVAAPARLDDLPVGAVLRFGPAGVGAVVLQITAARIPCAVLAGHLSAAGAVPADVPFVRKFAAFGRPGPYFSVVEPGWLRAGDDIAVLSVPKLRLSVADYAACVLGRPGHDLRHLVPLSGVIPADHAAKALRRVARVSSPTAGHSGAVTAPEGGTRTSVHHRVLGGHSPGSGPGRFA